MTAEIHQRIAAMGDDDPTLKQIEAFAWREYVRPRAALGSKQEREMRLTFVTRVDGAYDRMYSEAKRVNERLQFTTTRLRLLAIVALENPCPFCQDLFGVEQLGFTYEVPYAATNSKPWRTPNLIVCDALCSTGKGSLSGHEFREISAALLVADRSAAMAARQALAEGRLRLAARGRGSFPGGARRG